MPKVELESKRPCQLTFANASIVFDVFNVLQLRHGYDLGKLTKPIMVQYFNALVRGQEYPGSIMLLGRDRVPTFFYPPFRLTESIILEASSFVAALHVIETQLIHEFIGRDSRPIPMWNPDFLPIMIQTLFSTNLPVQRVSARFAVGLLGKVEQQKIQQLLEPYVRNSSSTRIERYSGVDRFLVALLMSTHENLVPDEYFAPLFRFLVDISEEVTEAATVALAALLQGFAMWTKCADGQQGLYLIIIKGLIRRPYVDFLDDLFCQIAYAEFESFMKVFSPLILEFVGKRDEENITRLLNLYTQVAVKNQKICGGWVSLAIAELWEKSTTMPYVPKDILAVLHSHANLFDAVSMSGDVCLIGTPNGRVTLFRNGKCIFSHIVFSGAATHVSLGPRARFGVAVSLDIGQAALFSIPEKPALFRQAKSVEMKPASLDTVDPGACYSITWNDEKEFVFQMTPAAQTGG
jgi:hypothetical protein